jgi:beta-galactosidase
MTELTRRDLLRGGLALSVVTLVSDAAMAHANALLSGYPGVASAEATAAIGPRERLLFDFGWKFCLGSDSDPLRDLDFGKDQSSYQGGFAKTGGFDFAVEKFDDSKWSSLNLPHDWAVELPFVHDETLLAHGYKPLGRKYPETSVGWYRRTFDIPASDVGRRILLEFDGASRSALVFLNGCFIGRNDNGYAPFHFDITDFLNYGEKNFLVVRLDVSYGDGWYYEGAGIYRHVWLTKTDALHLGKWESYVRSDVKGKIATLTLGTVVLNEGGRSERLSVHWQILDADGNTVAEAESSQSDPLAPGNSATFTSHDGQLRAPKHWSPEAPYLYSAIVSVKTDGKLRDAERISFGVRTVAFDADKGFFLNGKSIKIKGTCNHQDHAGVGTAVPDRLQWYRLAVLREMGCNAVRTSHNMPTPEWVEACDRMGMMMMCETRVMSSNPEGLAQLETMIKRYRNSPAIILWSMGNEEWIIQGKPQGEHIIASMVAHAHQLDPSRLCTAAVNENFGQGVSRALDVEGINYHLSEIDKYHQTHPRQPLVGSETASTVSTRGVYITDKLRNWLSSYDTNHPEWAALAEEWWKFYAARDYLPGGFAWTGFDYRGEPTPYGWPSINSQFGIVDTCGFPKDNFFYYKAWWAKDPVLHVFPHWNWDERIGEPISVWVHSNLDEVELFLNGQSQGSQKVQPLTHLEWKVKYEPGVLEARGRKDGRVVLIEKRETTGAPATIKLTADRVEIDADGEDIAIVRVEVLDNNGRDVPTADNLIRFRIDGQGALLGVGNGDPNCQESDKEPRRSLFNGLAQLIVQSTMTPGTINIEAHMEGWSGDQPPPAQLTIATKNVELRPAVDQ